MKRFSYIAAVLAVSVASLAIAQTTRSVPAGRGTLTFSFQTIVQNCETSPGRPTHDTLYSYTNFSYTEGTTTTQLSSMEASRSSGPTGGSCIPEPTENGSAKTSTFAVTFVPSGTTGGGSASVNYFSIGYINPKYIVVGVTYAPPGPSSSVTYTVSHFLSNTTSAVNTFSNSNMVSVSLAYKGMIPGVTGGSVTVDSSTTTAQTQATTNTLTLSSESSLSNTTYGTGSELSPVNHDYDILWLWLNPVAIFTVDPNNQGPVTWDGYGYDENDQPGLDIVKISVGQLNGHFAIDPSLRSALNRSWAGNKQTFASGNPGLTSADFQAILSLDPFLTINYAKPYASTTPDGRFTLASGAGQSFDYAQALPGDHPSSTTLNNSTTATTIQGQSATSSISTEFGVDFSFSSSLFFTSFQRDLKYSNTYTTTYQTNSTLTSTTTDNDALTIVGPSCTGNPCTPQYAGPPSFEVYQDNIWGTFAFLPN